MAVKLLCSWGLVSRAPSILSFCWSFFCFLIFIFLVLWTLQEKSSYDFFLFFLAIVSSFPLFDPGIFTVGRRNFFEIIDISCMISHFCSFTYENRENCLSFILTSYIEFYENCLNAVWCSFFVLQCLIQLYFKSPFPDIRFVLFYECPFCLDRGSVFLNLIKIIN